MIHWLKKILNLDPNEGHIFRYKKTVDIINSLEDSLLLLSDAELRAKTDQFKARFASGEGLHSILPEAFAVVREASKRTLGLRHHDVQLIGGMAMHEGKIAEMRTGEGKTLVATLSMYLNAISGEGVHLVTVNDFLARRDASWMGQIYDFLGLSVAVVNSGDKTYMYDSAFKAEDSPADQERDEEGFFKVSYDFLKPCTRQEAYRADITYGTNNEFAFDYLRDNLVYEKERLRQRPLNFAIVDEVDSVLIDEARTPLIISAPHSDPENLYGRFADLVKSFEKDIDYEVDEKLHQISIKEVGIQKAEEMLGIDNLYAFGGIKYIHHLETAVKAKSLYIKDKEYVIQNNNVVIVDQFTGRLMPSRRYSDGIHQALEAKEHLTVQQESRTFASISFQNYFRMYRKIAGMTGTGKTSEEEFFKVFGLEVVTVPTHHPNARVDKDDFIFATKDAKFKAIAKKVQELNAKGQPVLIGTVSVENNELLSEYLKKEQVPHQVLNAKNHEHEASITAEAGKRGAVTIATNMAGRGVDIKLGGADATKEEAQEIKSLGGLFVIGTERHDARRIDNQLRGRSGRQGDPGETQFFISLDDDLMRIFGSEKIKSLMKTMNMPEDQPISIPMVTRSLESAQTRIEGHHFDARRNVLAYDDVLNHHRSAIYARRYALLSGDRAHIEDILQEYLGDQDSLKADIQHIKELVGVDEFYGNVRRIMLQMIDMLWVDHLEIMEYLRSSVNLRAYGQQDPLVEYKKEALHLFSHLTVAIKERTIETIVSMTQKTFEEEARILAQIEQEAKMAGQTNVSYIAEGESKTAQAGDKIGRNDIVTIKKGDETLVMKYKKAEQMIATGGWTVLSVEKAE